MRVNRQHTLLQRKFLAATFEREDYIQANGAVSNNKFVIERLRGSELEPTVIEALGVMATGYQADLLLSVPSGGDWLVEAVSRDRGIQPAYLKKNHKDKSFIVPPDTVETIVASKRIVVVDDILNMLTNTRKVLALPGVGEKAVAAVGVIDRGPTDRPELAIPTIAVLRMEVPPVLPAKHDLWAYADQQVA